MSAKRKADAVDTDDIVQAALRQAEQEKKAKKQGAPGCDAISTKRSGLAQALKDLYRDCTAPDANVVRVRQTGSRRRWQGRA